MPKTKGFEKEKELSRYAYFDNHQLFTSSGQKNLLYRYSKYFIEPKIPKRGKGNEFISDFFIKANFDFLTFDNNKNLKSNIIGNMSNMNTLIDMQVDIILYSEVMGHIEFDIFYRCMNQLSQESRQYAIIALPELRKILGANMQLRLPKLKVFSRSFFAKIRRNVALGSGNFREIRYDKDTSCKSIENIIKRIFCHYRVWSASYKPSIATTMYSKNHEQRDK